MRTLVGNRRLLQLMAVASLLWLPGEVLAQEGANIEVPDLYVLVDRVGEEVELLRYTMGKLPNEQPPMPVDDVQPHEAFFQAQNLFRKANRLAREVAGVERKVASTTEGEVRSADIHAVVNSALQEVLLVKAELGITDAVQPLDRDARFELADVFRAIVQANRQLNLLTEHVFTPEDVFEQLELAISYTAGVLSSYPDAVTVPDEPAFESGKMPTDSYRRLTQCLRLTRGIAEETGIKLLRFDPRSRIRQDVLPSDVYDLATIVVAYIGHLASNLDAPEADPELSTPEHIFPSHVYQRAGVLEQQLIALEELVQ